MSIITEIEQLVSSYDKVRHSDITILRTADQYIHYDVLEKCCASTRFKGIRIGELGINIEFLNS